MQRRTGRIRIDARLAETMGRPSVVTIDSGRNGPSVAVTANVHGDECTGVLAVQEIDRWLESSLSRGVVHLYPSLNPVGLASRTRGAGADGDDLNRLFPGDPEGGPAERLAHAIWKDLGSRGLGALVDLHADTIQAVPYAILDRPIGLRGARRLEMERRLVACGASTGLVVMHDYPADAYARYGLDRSLTGAMVNHAHVVSVTIESGPRRVVDGASVRVAVDAVRGVLAHLGLVDESPPRSTNHARRWRRSTHLRVHREGLLVPRRAPGELFSSGDVVAEVRGVLGDLLEQVRADTDGLVVAWPDMSWVGSGASIGTLAIPDGDAR